MKILIFTVLFFCCTFAFWVSASSNNTTERQQYQVVDITQEYNPKLPLNEMEDLVVWMFYNHVPPSRKLDIPHNMSQKATISKNDTIDFVFGLASSGGINSIGYNWTIYGCDSIVIYIPPYSTKIVEDEAPWIKRNLEHAKYGYPVKKYSPGCFGGEGRVIIENDSVKFIRGIFYY